jgi:UDP-N-acetylmuramate-alanine ligase
MVPHHLLAGELIASFFKTAKETGEAYDTVIVLGPNHKGEGADISIADCGYRVSFGDADMVIVPDIYPGRDIDKGEIHARDLVEAISKNSPCAYIPTFEEINAYLEKNASPGDVVITLGSGSVNNETKKLL